MAVRKEEDLSKHLEWHRAQLQRSIFSYLTHLLFPVRINFDMYNFDVICWDCSIRTYVFR